MPQLKVSEPRMVNNWTVTYTKPNKKTGKVETHVYKYCDNVAEYTRIVEKRGGRVIHVSEPRLVETMSVYF